MTISTTTYFKIEKDAPFRKALFSYLDAEKAFADHTQAMAEKYGGEACIVGKKGIEGLAMDVEEGKKLKDFKQKTKKAQQGTMVYFVPVGSSVKKEFAKVKSVTGWDLADAIGFEPPMVNGKVIMPAIIGDAETSEIVLQVPVTPTLEWQPKGAKEMTPLQASILLTKIQRELIKR
jgi:hypothetical protein